MVGSLLTSFASVCMSFVNASVASRAILDALTTSMPVSFLISILFLTLLNLPTSPENSLSAGCCMKEGRGGSEYLIFLLASLSLDLDLDLLFSTGDLLLDLTGDLVGLLLLRDLDL